MAENLSEENNMKKTILVGIIAVAMLFAFTACEQQPIDVNGYVPTMATVTPNGVIIDGQEITADLFTGTVTYRNGETAVIPVTVDTTKKTASIDCGNSVTASYTYKTVTAEKAVVNNASVKDITVGSGTGNKVTPTLEDGYTVTLSYGDTSVTVEPSTEVTVTVEEISTAAKGAQKAKLTVKVGANTISCDTTVDVNVVEAAKVAKITATVATPNGEYYGQPVTVTLKAVDANGKEVTDKSITLGTDVVIKGSTVVSAFPTTLSDKQVVYTLSYIADPTVVCDQVVIPAGADYIASLTSSKTAALKTGVTLSAGQPLDASMLNVPVTYANTAAHTDQEYAPASEIYLITTDVPTTGSSFAIRYQVRTGYNGTWSSIQTLSGVAFTGGTTTTPANPPEEPQEP